MAERGLPAWGRPSMVLRLPEVDPLEGITPEWAWGGSAGEGVRVAIVDSGVEAAHPDLHGCVDTEAGVAFDMSDDGEVVAVEGPHEDLFGHGTACAGIIHSIAPAARITSVRVLGARLSGKAAVFAQGLAWAIERDFDIINLSLGTTKQDWALPFHDLADRAYFRGTLLVTAANNQRRVSYPSLYASVLSVASSFATDPMRFHYNPEPPTEFLARGIDVDLAWKGGGRITGSGNSYAAPHLAGVAALIRAKHPQLRPFQLKAVLWATAANVLEAPVPAGRRSSSAHLTSIRATTAVAAVRAPGRH